LADCLSAVEGALVACFGENADLHGLLQAVVVVVCFNLFAVAWKRGLAERRLAEEVRVRFRVVDLFIYFLEFQRDGFGTSLYNYKFTHFGVVSSTFLSVLTEKL